MGFHKKDNRVIKIPEGEMNRRVKPGERIGHTVS